MRPIIHRASTVEIIVPYGDPRSPFHKKCAFDVVDYGLGFSCSSLELGCDCLGHVSFRIYTCSLSLVLAKTDTQFVWVWLHRDRTPDQLSLLICNVFAGIICLVNKGMSYIALGAPQWMPSSLRFCGSDASCRFTTSMPCSTRIRGSRC